MCQLTMKSLRMKQMCNAQPSMHGYTGRVWKDKSPYGCCGSHACVNLCMCTRICVRMHGCLASYRIINIIRGMSETLSVGARSHSQQVCFGPKVRPAFNMLLISQLLGTSSMCLQRSRCVDLDATVSGPPLSQEAACFD